MRIQITKTVEKTWHFNGTYEEFIDKLGLTDTSETRKKFDQLIEDELIEEDEFGEAIESILDKQFSDPDIDVHVFKN